MKKISFLLALAFVITGCTGDRGPAGPRGLDGLDGLDAEFTKIFEIVGDFTPQNDYQFGFEFPPNQVEVFESDIVLVYLLEEVFNDQSGPVDVWTPLPATFFFDDSSQMVYNFNHTFFDVNIFLDGNTNLASVSNDLLLDQTFRIAIIPAEFAEAHPNLNSYESLMQAMPSVEVLKLK